MFHPDFMGSRAHITQLNIISSSETLYDAGFRSGDELRRINDKEFQDFPDGPAYKNVASYTVLRKQNEETADIIKIEIPEENRKIIASELFGPRDESFIYTTDVPFF